MIRLLVRELKARQTRLSGNVSIPRIRVPGLFDFLENGQERLGVLPLKVITAIVVNIDHGIVLQPQDGARVECKPMLERDVDSGWAENLDGFLDCHGVASD